jgi:hypothetical protein
LPANPHFHQITFGTPSFREVFQKIASTFARLKDAAGGSKMPDQPPRQHRRRLDVIIADVVAIGLEAPGKQLKLKN